jgi:hypothetical protein
MNDRIAAAILNLLGSDPTFGKERLVMSCLTVVESLEPDGTSTINVIMSDKRLSVNFGLLATGQMIYASNGARAQHSSEE